MPAGGYQPYAKGARRPGFALDAMLRGRGNLPSPIDYKRMFAQHNPLAAAMLSARRSTLRRT